MRGTEEEASQTILHGHVPQHQPAGGRGQDYVESSGNYLFLFLLICLNILTQAQLECLRNLLSAGRIHRWESTENTPKFLCALIQDKQR